MTATETIINFASADCSAGRYRRSPLTDSNTGALVLVGVLITFQKPLNISLTPELILPSFVPPLIFEAAIHLEFISLRESGFHLKLCSVNLV